MRRPPRFGTGGCTRATSGGIDGKGRLTITGRKKEIIVLSSGKNIYPEEIETVYRNSAFIKELCVLGLARPGEPSAERLYAVVVPDDAMLRERKIANVGDIIRFEMEGASVHLPHHKRVLGYEIWFEPLPRTSTGKIKRFEVERRVKAAEVDAKRAGRCRTERGRPRVSRSSRAGRNARAHRRVHQGRRARHARRQPRTGSRARLDGARRAADGARAARRRGHP